jgi:hypothetical protein
VVGLPTLSETGRVDGVLGCLTSVVMQTLTQCPMGVKFTAASFSADVIATAVSCGVRTYASSFCSRGTTFSMATPW